VARLQVLEAANLNFHADEQHSQPSKAGRYVVERIGIAGNCCIKHERRSDQ
jgi:hypothetical protein